MRKKEDEVVREDKQHICDLLLKTLHATRNGCELEELAFDPDTETVTGRFKNGCIWRCNVWGDSGVSMIRDVVRHIKM